MKLRAPLAEDDISRDYRLAAKLLDTQPLACAVASIFDAPLTFLVSHKPVLYADRFYLEPGQLPAMADRAVIAFPAAILVGDLLLALRLADDFADHARALEVSAHADSVALANEEDLIESDFVAGFACELLDGKDFARACTVLFTTGFENCVRHGLMKKGAETLTAVLC